MRILDELKDWCLQRRAREAIKKKDWAKKVTPVVFKRMREMGALIVFMLLLSCAQAENIPNSQYTIDQLANAIYKAENSKPHPYGILAHYKHTTPRQACINTINHALRDWNGKGDFIEFLGKRYCPTQGKDLTNDEKRLNIYWVKNVKFFLEKGYKDDSKNR